MDSISAVAGHFAHPFTSTLDNHKITLSPLEKQIATIVAVASLILVVITPFAALAAPVLFYGLTGFFKCRNLNEGNTTAEVQKAEDIAFTYIPVKPQRQNNHKVKAQTKVSAKSQTQNMHKVDAQTHASANKPTPALRSPPPPFPKPPRKLKESYQLNETIDMTSNTANSSANSSSYASTLTLVHRPISELEKTIHQIMTDPSTDSTEKKIRASSLFNEVNNMNEIMSHLRVIFNGLDINGKLAFMQSLPDYLQDEFFKHFLTQLFTPLKIRGNGNCCVYALVRFQNPDISDEDEDLFAKTLRDQTVTYMRNNPENFRPFCEDFDEYLNQMSQNGKWFGPQEIRAFAESTQTPVIVYNPNNVYLDEYNNLLPRAQCIFGFQYLNNTPKRIYLYHKNGNHYDLLNLKAGTFPILPRTS